MVTPTADRVAPVSTPTGRADTQPTPVGSPSATPDRDRTIERMLVARLGAAGDMRGLAVYVDWLSERGDPRAGPLRVLLRDRRVEYRGFAAAELPGAEHALELVAIEWSTRGDGASSWTVLPASGADGSAVWPVHGQGHDACPTTRSLDGQWLFVPARLARPLAPGHRVPADRSRWGTLSLGHLIRLGGRYARGPGEDEVPPLDAERSEVPSTVGLVCVDLTAPGSSCFASEGTLVQGAGWDWHITGAGWLRARVALRELLRARLRRRG